MALDFWKRKADVGRAWIIVDLEMPGEKAMPGGVEEEMMCGVGHEASEERLVGNMLH